MSKVAFEVKCSDIAAGTVLATISGSAQSIVTAERVALNFLGPLSGTATATAALVKSKLHKTLQKFLEKNIVKKNLQVPSNLIPMRVPGCL